MRLPEFDELDGAEESSAAKALSSTEDVLKRLLMNIFAFKKIEQDNIKLRAAIVRNQELLKTDYRKKLSALGYALREKEALGGQAKKNVLLGYKKFAENLTVQMLKERQFSSHLKRKYSELYAVAKKTAEDNKRLKAVLVHGRALAKEEIEKKSREISEKQKADYDVYSAKHRGILKEHEKMRIDLSGQLEKERERAAEMGKRHERLAGEFSALQQENRKYKRINEKLLMRLALLENKSLANEAVVEAKAKEIEAAFEKKLKEVLKTYLGKEVDYKAKIDSLSKDLAKYYEEAKESKRKYYQRETQLKEKLKEIIG